MIRYAACALLALSLSFGSASAAALPSGVQPLGSPTTASIPSSGGVSTFADGTLTVQAFADPTRAPLTLEYQAVDARTLPPAQTGLSLGFGAFQLSTSPAVDSFTVPLNLVITPGESNLSLALGELERLRLGTWNGSVWLGVPCWPDAVTGARLVCSVTRLGLFVPLIALPINANLQRFDMSVPNGHFYAQGNGFDGGGGLGFYVVDDDDASLWSAFQRQGGADRLGYPVGQRFVVDGNVRQTFQRGTLEWLPELGDAQLIHVMTELHLRGDDAWLDTTHQIPPAPPGGTPTDESILSPFPSILSAYEADRELYGAPVSIKQYNRLVSARFQRSTLQTLAGSSDVISGAPGELARAAGLVPASATTPAPPPTG